VKKSASIFLAFLLIFSLILSTNIQVAQAASNNNLYKPMYTSILNAIKSQKTKVNLSSYLRKGQKFSWQYLYEIENNEPTIFYLDYKKIKFWSNGVLELGYKYSKSTTLTMQKTMNQRADSIIKKVIKKGMDDGQKVMAIHDYLADYITYDMKNYKRNTIPAKSYTAYGALVKKVAVCDGYTHAMDLLMKKAGIESHRVVGKGYHPDGSGEAHSWNLLKVKGAYYYLDMTWDDRDIKDKPDARYKYFLVTQKELSRDHTWNKKGLPVVTSNKYKELHRVDNDSIKTKDGIFFSDDKDNFRLYFIKLDGSGKKRLTSDRAINSVVSGQWVYFSNYSKGGYLYKVKTDGKQQTQLNSRYTIPQRFDSGKLIVKDGNTNKEFVFS
jgi:hypothetical protein